MLYIIILFSVFCYFGSVVSTCQVIGWKDSSEDTYLSRGDYLHGDHVEECLCVLFGLVYCFIVCLSPAVHNIFLTVVALWAI